MRLLISLLLLACFFSGCKQYTPENLPDARVHFGSKGGITGGAREYVLLLDKGKLLFCDEFTGKFEAVGKFTKEELTAVKKDLEKIAFSKEGGTPGNYNTTLTYHHDGQADRLRWSQPAGASSPEAKACYNDLMEAVRRLRKTK